MFAYVGKHPLLHLVIKSSINKLTCDSGMEHKFAAKGAECRHFCILKFRAVSVMSNAGVNNK